MALKNVIKVALAGVLAAALCPGSVCAQRYRAQPRIEELPRYPLDTLDTSDPDFKVVLYSNNTWSYFRIDTTGYAENPVYVENWDTTGVFSYKSIELEDLPTVVNLQLLAEAGDEFHYPIKGTVRSPYGPRRRRNHNGVDISLKTGEPIYACFDGKVRYARYNTGGFGYLVIVRHTNGLETWYAHLSRLNVSVNDYVKAGQVIGFGGSTGRSTGPHLHFEMRYCDQTFDPQFLIDFPAGELKFQTFALDKKFFNIHSRASEMLEEDDDDMALFAETVTPDKIVEGVRKNGGQGATVRASDGDPVYHTIVSGDMLGKLAIKYKVSVRQICALNGITEKTILRPGKRLRIK